MTVTYFTCVKYIINIVVNLVGYLYIMVHYPINNSPLMVPVLSQHIQSTYLVNISSPYPQNPL
jgi:hypothetical protein